MVPLRLCTIADDPYGVSTVDEDAIREANRIINEARAEIDRTRKMDQTLQERSAELNTARSNIKEKLVSPTHKRRSASVYEELADTSLTVRSQDEVRTQLENLRALEQKNAKIQINLGTSTLPSLSSRADFLVLT